MPDALSSAPGAPGTVSRWAPTTSQGCPGCGSPRVAIRLTEDPPGTGAVQEKPAGVGNRCLRTSHPESSSRCCTQAAARKYAAEVPGRGPIRPASWSIASSAVRSRASSGETRAGVGVGSSAGSVGAVDAVGAVVAGVAGAWAEGSDVGASSASVQAARSSAATVTPAAAAARAMLRRKAGAR